MKNKKGFTLIELLVVIAIIGLLATIVLVGLNKAGQKARDATRKANLAQIQKALEMYYYDNPGNGNYPSEAWCDSSVGSCGHACPCGANDWSQTCGIWTGLVGNKILGRLPKDPTNNSTYYYYYEPDCNQGACAGKGCCGHSIGCRLEQGGSFILKSGY
jgi:prepilin-type N-terminal cleavage/methylation domain-containing protein